MRKNLIGVTSILLASCLILNSGCEKKGDSGTGKVTIRYLNFENYPAQVALNKAAVDEFNRSQSRIFVKYEQAISLEKVLVELSASPPDVFYWCEIAKLVETGSLLNLTPLIEKDKGVNLNDYFNQVTDYFRFGDGLYAFPLHYGTAALVYNKTLFEKCNVPLPDETWTWKDCMDAAVKLTRDTDGDERKDQFGIARIYGLQLISLFGGRIIGEDGQSLVDSSETRNALKFMLALDDAGVTPEASPDIISTTKGAISIFLSGKLGMYVASAFQITSMSAIKDFEWDVAPIPKAEDGKRQAGFGAGGLCISSKTKYPKETFEFVQFYCGKPGQAIQSKGKNSIPALKEYAYSPDYFCRKPPEHIKIFVDGITYAILEPRMSWYPELRDKVINLELDLLLLRKRTIEEVITNIDNGIKGFLNNPAPVKK